MNEKWPNFLMIGAPKCGTRSLYSYIKQHPDIYMPEYKEPHFFAYHNEKLTLPIDDVDSPEYQRCRAYFDHYYNGAITDVSEYTALFKDARQEKAVGEASTTSLYHPPAVANIKQYVPNAKLIAILRNPAERAFSAYLDAIRRGHETRSFREALDQEPFDSDYIWWGPGKLYFIRVAFYSQQLQRYFDNFPREQIKIFLFDDFKQDAGAVVTEIFDFLEVDTQFVPDMSAKENVSGVPINENFSSWLSSGKRFLTRCGWLKNAMKHVLPKKFKKRLTNAKRIDRIRDNFDALNQDFEWQEYHDGQYRKPSMPEDIHRHLIEIYRDDILNLQNMLGRDLSAWLSTEKTH